MKTYQRMLSLLLCGLLLMTSCGKAEIQNPETDAVAGENDTTAESETDALFLWTLHVSPKYRLGLGRLRELYEEFFSCEKKFMTSTVPNRKRIRNAIRVSLKMKTNR